ncbi:MAG: hypothetical protein WDN50_16575 [Bradyrhizobium sp.]
MKLFTGWIVSAGLVFTAATAHAQGVAPQGTSGSPYVAVSDFGGPYAAMPREAPGYGYGPTLLPPQEVYTVVRENGFSPLGVPQQRGMFYVISVIDRGGDDGRLVIDARNGRMVRFTPAYRTGYNSSQEVPVVYGSGVAALPPMSNARGVPRPPASVPQVASRTTTVPLPKASPLDVKALAPKLFTDKPATDKPASAPAQQSAAVQAKPADAPAAPQAAAPAVVEAKPAPQILPTQEMPKAQGLE